MPWRFHRILKIIPGVRVNVGKGGVSTSVGPRGADINIGRHGVTTNAGLPGTGLSYRQKLGRPGSWLGIATVIVALALSAYRYSDRIAAYFHPAAAPPGVTASDAPHVRGRTSNAADAVIASATPASGVRYVRRNNSDLRARPSASAPAIAKEAKGTQVALLALADKWSQVRVGGVTGWMRSSVLGEMPPKTN
ncbi:MAG TPA: DUF4236 domain-containing protein [Rhizomicrobium sp.]|jgi:hypothetical protein|nr:DUF4236 domain-containing protein [Rhizomicrobium sp.]